MELGGVLWLCRCTRAVGVVGRVYSHSQQVRWKPVTSCAKGCVQVSGHGHTSTWQEWQMGLCVVSRANLKWMCPGDPSAHHGVMPCAPDKVLPLEDGQVSPQAPPVTSVHHLGLGLGPPQVHDSFAGFRSRCLNLQLSLDVQPGEEEVCFSCLCSGCSHCAVSCCAGHPTYSSPVCKHVAMAAAVSSRPVPCHLSAHPTGNCA